MSFEGKEQCELSFEEGHIYEGDVTALGGEGPPQRWIAVAPFGKRALHSIGHPLDLHYMPVCVAADLITTNRLHTAGLDPHHPVVRLQRAKEFFNIRDTHMGIYENNLQEMINLLEEAIHTGEDYAVYAAGEILAMLKSADYQHRPIDDVKSTIRHLIAGIQETEWPVGVLWHAEVWS
jgi:hypothetical protein